MLNSGLVLAIYFVAQILAACAVMLYQYLTLGTIPGEIDAPLYGTALLFLNLVLVAVLPLARLVRKPKAWLGGAEERKEQLQYGYGMELAAAVTFGADSRQRLEELFLRMEQVEGMMHALAEGCRETSEKKSEKLAD